MDLIERTIYGFNEFTFPEIGHIQQLGLVPDVNVLVYFDYEEANGPLYGNFGQVLGHLTAAGFQELDLDKMQINIPETERRPFQHHMRRNLFRTVQRIPNRQFDPFIRAIGFFSRQEEAQGIASLVKSLVVDERIPPERICITTRFGWIATPNFSASSLRPTGNRPTAPHAIRCKATRW